MNCLIIALTFAKMIFIAKHTQLNDCPLVIEIDCTKFYPLRSKQLIISLKILKVYSYAYRLQIFLFLTFFVLFDFQASCSRKHCHSRDLSQSWCQRCSMTCPMEIAGQAGTAAAGAPVDDLTTDDDDSAFSLVRRFFLRFLIGRNLSEYS